MSGDGLGGMNHKKKRKKRLSSWVTVLLRKERETMM